MLATSGMARSPVAENLVAQKRRPSSWIPFFEPLDSPCLGTYTGDQSREKLSSRREGFQRPAPSGKSSSLPNAAMENPMILTASARNIPKNDGGSPSIMFSGRRGAEKCFRSRQRPKTLFGIARSWITFLGVRALRKGGMLVLSLFQAMDSSDRGNRHR